MKHNIYRSAAQVTVFSTMEKALSFLYRIILSRIIGAEGIGIYQICLSVFAVFLTVASSGVPVTVSRLMAKSNAQNDAHGKHAAVTAGVIATLIITVPVALVLFFGRNLFGFLFSDKRCAEIFLILLPGLVLTSIYAVIRGSFWGNKQFLPYSVIELLEDAVMVGIGIALVYNVTDPIIGARNASIAVVISYVFSFVVSLFWYFIRGGRFVNPKKQLKPLISSSLPITAMRTATSLINSAVAVILPLLLMKMCNLSNSEAISMYGIAMGMSLPILFIPSSLIGSIAVVVAPELSENYYKGNEKAVKFDVEKSVKAAIFISALLIPILFVLGKNIGTFLYSNNLAGEIVQNCSFILLPMCVAMITTTVLNSMNCEKRTLINYFCGAAAMMICIFALTKFIGIYGYMAGAGANFLITAILNVSLLRKKCAGLKIGKYLLRAIGVTLASCAFGYALIGILSRYLPVFWQIFVGAIALIIFSGAFLYCLEMFTFNPFKKLVAKR